MENIRQIILDSEIRKYLKKIIEYEEKKEEEFKKPMYEGLDLKPYWGIMDIPVPWQIVRKLVFANVVKPFGGRRKEYLLINRTEIKRLLDEVELQERIQEIPLIERKEEIPSDLFSTVIKREDLVKLFKYSLEAEKPVHILMVSKPGAAKTAILLEIARLPNAEYILGSSTTKSGLSDQLFRKFRDGDKCIIIIDEIDKMRTEDYGVLLSLQETGIVKDVKSGKTREMHLNATVYAAANSLKRIPKENLDRFEIINVPEYSENEFREVVKNILIKREGASEEIANYIAQKIPKKSVRQAIRIFRASKGEREKVDEIIRLLKMFGE